VEVEGVSGPMGCPTVRDPIGRAEEILIRSAGISHGFPDGGGPAHMPASMLRLSHIQEVTGILQ
jgi:hypothetical protein